MCGGEIHAPRSTRRTWRQIFNQRGRELTPLYRCIFKDDGQRSARMYSPKEIDCLTRFKRSNEDELTGHHVVFLSRRGCLRMAVVSDEVLSPGASPHVTMLTASGDVFAEVIPDRLVSAKTCRSATA